MQLESRKDFIVFIFLIIIPHESQMSKEALHQQGPLFHFSFCSVQAII